MSDEAQFDVLEVDIKTLTVRLMNEEPKSLKNADAIMNMAIMRRGNDHNFFNVVETGIYKDGDEFKYEAKKEQPHE